jgi:ABC-2 type transport system permease protein
MRLLGESWYLNLRQVRGLLRQPWYVALTLVQPIIWLVLYGQLFRRVVELPGFKARSYIDFITPGIVIMSALFASGWTGMGIIVDIDNGVMDRLLVSPVNRWAIIIGRLMNLSIITTVQSLILFGLGALLGARFTGGVAGLLILLLAAILLGIPFAALSIALGFTMRKSESVIGAVNFILLPLTFLSPVFMANNLMPEWMHAAAQLNPVNWSVEAGRGALAGNADWARISLYLTLLVLFGFVSCFLAVRAFRAYQRSA